MKDVNILKILYYTVEWFVTFTSTHNMIRHVCKSNWSLYILIVTSLRCHEPKIPGVLLKRNDKTTCLNILFLLYFLSVVCKYIFQIRCLFWFIFFLIFFVFKIFRIAGTVRKPNSFSFLFLMENSFFLIYFLMSHVNAFESRFF